MIKNFHLGSTIEMLRSENVQVRSQLSTIQRRMFQEKQQIMDYLRKIENDLIEKEQIKQREALLRQEYEQLKSSIQHDQQKIVDLQHKCDRLTQRVNEFNQTGDDKAQKSDELQQNLAVLTAQCAQLQAANQAWQEFHQSQLENFRNKLQHNLPIENNFSFDEIADYLNKREHLTDSIKDTHVTSSEISVQSTPLLINDHDAELRDKIDMLTTQCAELDKANRAWQQYQLAQIDQFRNTLRDYLPLEENVSFDQAAQLIVDQLIKERDELKALEKTNEELQLESATNLDTIKESYINTVNELTQELSVIKEEVGQVNERYQELEKENLDLQSGNSHR